MDQSENCLLFFFLIKSYSRYLEHRHQRYPPNCNSSIYAVFKWTLPCTFKQKLTKHAHYLYSGLCYGQNSGSEFASRYFCGEKLCGIKNRQTFNPVSKVQSPQDNFQFSCDFEVRYGLRKIVFGEEKQ